MSLPGVHMRALCFYQMCDSICICNILRKKQQQQPPELEYLNAMSSCRTHFILSSICFEFNVASSLQMLCVPIGTTRCFQLPFPQHFLRVFGTQTVKTKADSSQLDAQVYWELNHQQIPSEHISLVTFHSQWIRGIFLYCGSNLKLLPRSERSSHGVMISS